jgi:hypothetical protein
VDDVTEEGGLEHGRRKKAERISNRTSLYIAKESARSHKQLRNVAELCFGSSASICR